MIDVHARDVCKILAKQGVNDELDFDWISQLRQASQMYLHFISLLSQHGMCTIRASSNIVTTLCQNYDKIVALHHFDTTL